ncbi:MAG: YkgJ family cysteine cluster protein [Chthoniobacterales bacterium]
MKRRDSPGTADAVGRVREIYRELAARPVERSCTRLQECCHFRLTGRTPFLTRGEALVAARAVRASGRRELPQTTDGSCPLLNQTTGACMIYADRPFGCRTHFCAAAGGPYARHEVADLIQRLDQIDFELGGNGASGLPHAVREALQQLR